MKQFVILVYFICSNADVSRACTVCFGDPNSMLTKGLNWGIISLLAVLSVLMALFISFFISVKRRSHLTTKDAV